MAYKYRFKSSTNYQFSPSRKPRKYSEEIIDKIITLINENKTTNEISIELDIGKPIINYYRLKQKGTNRRSRGST